MEENAATDLECDFMRPAEVRRASEDREAAVSMIRSRYQGPGGRFELWLFGCFGVYLASAEHLVLAVLGLGGEGDPNSDCSVVLPIQILCM